MTAGRCVVEPDVACDGRRVVLAPFILETFAVLIEEACTAFVVADHFGRCGEHLRDASVADGHTVEFCQRTCREEGARGGVLDGGIEQDVSPVGREGCGQFGRRIERELPGRSAFGRHEEDVELAVAVAGEGE